MGPRARLRVQFVTLDSCAEQANRALSCVCSGARELEATIGSDRGGGLFGSGLVAQMRIAFAATALATMAMIVVIFV